MLYNNTNNNNKNRDDRRLVVELALGDGSSAWRVHPARSNSGKTLQHGELGDGPRRIFGAMLLGALYAFCTSLARCKKQAKQAGRPKTDHVNNFYDSQISTIFSRGVDERSLRPLDGRVETRSFFQKSLIILRGLNQGPQRFAFGGASLPQALEHQTKWQDTVKRESHAECTLPNFLPDDYFALPNMSKEST